MADGLNDEGLRALGFTEREEGELALDFDVGVAHEQFDDAFVAHTDLHELMPNPRCTLPSSWGV